MFAQDYCLISDTQCGRFKTDTMIIDSVSLNTDLITELEEIIIFIKKHLKVEFLIGGTRSIERMERFDYPLDAIREIVMNMLVHRDYRQSSNSIIKIFDNRIEFFNPGKLYGDLTIKDLLSNTYTSQTRNKLIAKAFKDIGMIEQYGSGIKRIFGLCKEHGVIAPMIEEFGNGLNIVIFNELQKDYKIAITKDGEKLSGNQKRILDIISKNQNATTAEIAEGIGISVRNVEKNLSKLKDIGMIQRIGPDKGGYWKIIKTE